jgi:hypothetical protein
VTGEKTSIAHGAGREPDVSTPRIGAPHQAQPAVICLYNDAYRASLGPERHPSILGARGRDAWPEIGHLIGPQIERVLRGEGSTRHENQWVPILRHEAIQDVYWTYSFGPIDDKDALKASAEFLLFALAVRKTSVSSISSINPSKTPTVRSPAFSSKA